MCKVNSSYFDRFEERVDLPAVVFIAEVFCFARETPRISSSSFSNSILMVTKGEYKPRGVPPDSFNRLVKEFHASLNRRYVFIVAATFIIFCPPIIFTQARHIRKVTQAHNHIGALLGKVLTGPFKVFQRHVRLDLTVRYDTDL